MRVAFLGPEGTFTEEALRASSPTALGGDVAEEVAYATVYEAVMAVDAGEVDRAVVPIENSLEGSVTATLDTLAIDARDVRIVAEVVRPVSHSLIARPGVRLDQVTRVISHPQALAQCRRLLAGQLRGVAAETAPSTAEAVRAVATSSDGSAALGNALAAELYGCVVLLGAVEDRDDNMTRFVWLGREDTRLPITAAKTSAVFWGFSDDSPGALVAVLDEFARREINLTKIESRPRRVSLGHYMFFVDLEGAASAPGVADALAALRGRVETLRVLGSYGALPAAAGSSVPGRPVK